MFADTGTHSLKSLWASVTLFKRWLSIVLVSLSAHPLSVKAMSLRWSFFAYCYYIKSRRAFIVQYPYTAPPKLFPYELSSDLLPHCIADLTSVPLLIIHCGWPFNPLLHGQSIPSVYHLHYMSRAFYRRYYHLAAKIVGWCGQHVRLWQSSYQIMLNSDIENLIPWIDCLL